MPGVCSSTLSSTETILETINEEEIQPRNVTIITTNKKPTPGIVRSEPSGAVIILGKRLYKIFGRKLSTTLKSHITTYSVIPIGAIIIIPWKKYCRIFFSLKWTAVSESFISQFLFNRQIAKLIIFYDRFHNAKMTSKWIGFTVYAINNKNNYWKLLLHEKFP